MKRIFAIILMTVFFVAFGAGYIISVPEAGACGPGCPGCDAEACDLTCGGFCQCCVPPGPPCGSCMLCFCG